MGGSSIPINPAYLAEQQRNLEWQQRLQAGLADGTIVPARTPDLADLLAFQAVDTLTAPPHPTTITCQPGLFSSISARFTCDAY